MSKSVSSDAEELLSALDGRGSEAEFSAIEELRSRNADLASLLLQHYRQCTRAGQRASCVYHALRHAPESPDAYRLGLEAALDRSKHVRYRACMLLAVAQNPQAIPTLRQTALLRGSEQDAAAAIDAIECRNHHYFIDRSHSGQMFLSIGGAS